MAKSGEIVRRAIKEYVVPGLRQRSFKGSFPHFRRETASHIELITFQFDRWGSNNFVVELATCPLGGVTMSWGENIDSKHVTAHHVPVRLRLGTTNEQSDYWFTSSSFGENPSAAGTQLLTLLDTQGISWWSGA
jgi:hypothetical protein